MVRQHHFILLSVSKSYNTDVPLTDMTGDGFDDYIWISSVGEMTLFGNRQVWGTWDQYLVIYTVNKPRREIHLADFDGDGKCDIM